MRSIICFLGCAILYSLSYGGTIDPSTPDSKYVEYGSKFHSVVKICGSYEDGRLFCASACLIDDYNFLTAAHVVHGAAVCYVTVEDIKFPIKRIIINKHFKDPAMSPLMDLLEETNPEEEVEQKEFGFGDLAIGYSEKPFGLKYYPPLYEKEDEAGKLCSISGYGLTGTFYTGIKKSDNKKRAGSNKVDITSGDKIICSPSKKYDSSYTSLEFMIGSGDSGGGLFIDGKLAGINSCVMAIGRSPSSKYGEESGHTRISKFIGWINEHKKKVD
jgi:hypothetical protein